MQLRRFFFLPLFLLGTTLFGQSFNFGVKGGVCLTNSFGNQNSGLDGALFTTSGSKDYIIGPTFEVGLPFGLGVEADALYRPLHYDFSLAAEANGQGASISSWEIPIVAKYHFHAPIVKPYVEAGASFRALGNLGSVISQVGEKLSNKGFTAGVGVDFKVPFIRISPEIRYTHWGGDLNAPAFGGVTSNQNQAEFLVGVSF